MGSPAPKTVSAEMLAAIAAAANKEVTKVPASVASNLKKTKYVGKKALAGATQRFGYAPSAYLG